MDKKDDFAEFRIIAGSVISKIKTNKMRELEELLEKNRNPHCGGTLDDDPDREKKWIAMQNCLNSLYKFTASFSEIQKIYYK